MASHYPPPPPFEPPPYRLQPLSAVKKPRYFLVGTLAGTLGIMAGCAFGVAISDDAVTATTSTPTSTPTVQRAASAVTERQWAKVVKDPDGHAGERYIVFGEVTQFDSATGKDVFRADTAHKNTTSSGYFDGKNTVMKGDASKLADVVEGDVFQATVTVKGASDYKTMLGGRTAVPELLIETIKVTGHN